MKTIVSEKGQITIPKSLRMRLGLKSGTVLIFTEKKGKLIAEKKSSQDVFSQWQGKGHIPFGKTTDDYLKAIRDGNSR
ncbi:MAG: AbrB/MazE/SpoVT family DNA-binding domain-containing protein [Verrucomicrobiia bacterium]